MSAPRLPRAMWSPLDDQTVIDYVRQGLSRADIAELMGRTPDAIMSRITVLRHRGQIKLSGDRPQPAPVTPTAALRLAAQSPKRRACLKCRKAFDSRHAGHRLCSYCSGRGGLDASSTPARVAF